MRKRTNLYFFLALLIIFIVAYIVYRTSEAQEVSRLQAEKTINVKLSGMVLTDWISQALEEIRFISSTGNVVAFVTDPTPHNRSLVTLGIYRFSEATESYDQIRILDLSGNELLRVDYEVDAPLIIPVEDLQDKSDRYYFIECAKLSVGEFYISPLDLNIENGEIEIPFKPMIRICTPVIDKNSKIKGILIFNYKAAQMLNRFSRYDDDLMLVNSDGYWLQSPNLNDEWTFMFDGGETFNARYSEEWFSILSSSSGSFETENGLWTFETIDPIKNALEESPHLVVKDKSDVLIHGKELYFWKVISRVSPETLNDIREEILIPILLIILVILPVVYFGIWNLNRRIELEKQANEHIRFMATHDMMTGLFNRAFFEAEMERLASSRSQPISIFSLDVNNLKVINDTYGHLEGDRLIENVAEILKQTFRSDDIVARVGGDEFAVLLPLTDQIGSQEIKERLLENIERFNQRDGVREVSVAVGTATNEEMEDLDMALTRADEKMYAMKALQKQNKNM